VARFSSTLRSTAVTARLLRALGVAAELLFVTGLLSHYQDEHSTWLREPAKPVWGYRLTQGIRVATGFATIPLLLVKLWSVYPNLFGFPPILSISHALERISVAILVSSALVQLAAGSSTCSTGTPSRGTSRRCTASWPTCWSGLCCCISGSSFPTLRTGSRPRLRTRGCGYRDPVERESVLPQQRGTLPAPPAWHLAAGCWAAAGAGIGVVVVTSVSQTLPPLEPIGLLARRQWTKGPQGVLVNRTADQAKIIPVRQVAEWRLQVRGPRPYELALADLEPRAVHEARLALSGESEGIKTAGSRRTQCPRTMINWLYCPTRTMCTRS
jgi:hypothetical protein